MKIIAAALLMLLGSAVAVPTLTEDERRQERFVTDLIQDAIQGIINSILDLGLDPVKVDQWSGSVALSEAELFSASAYLTNFKFEGLSKIVISNLNFSILFLRLQMTLTMPSLSVNIGSAGAEVAAMGRNLSASASGSLEIVNAAVSVDARVTIGIGTVYIRSLSISPAIGNIDSQLNVVVNDNDLSETINDVLGNRLPSLLEENRNLIEELLVEIVMIIWDRLW